MKELPLKNRSEKRQSPRRSALGLALAMFVVMVGIILLSYFVQLRNQNAIASSASDAGMYDYDASVDGSYGGSGS